MTTTVDRSIKLLGNREEVDARVPFLQSALGETTNTNILGKHDQRDQWKESIKMGQWDCLCYLRMVKE